MTTETTPLTIAELTQAARWIGRTCQYESEMRGKWAACQSILDAFTLANMQMGTVRNIRPVLRKLSSLTEEELHHIGKLLCKSAKIEHTFKPERSSNTVGGCFKADGYRNREYFAIFHDDLEVHIETGWYDEGKYDGRNRKWRALTPVAVIDYLDSISVDQRGYIQDGKAVEGE